jgi:hypothetical protein
MIEDQRQFERVRFLVEARWAGLSGNYEARVYDISLSGCYIETLGQVQLNEQVSFEIQSPSGRWIPLQGIVIHYQPSIGFGMHFLNMSDLQQHALAELIDYARSLPE